MPSQRHLVYLLPRAEPEELQEAIAGAGDLPPCTCSCTPLELRVRIPAPPSNSSPSAATSKQAVDTARSSPSHASRSSSPQSHSSRSTSKSTPSLPPSTRTTRQQFATWKLIAPQVKTISPTSNTYLLLEAFAGVSSTSLQASGSNDVEKEDRGNSLLAKVQQLNLGQTSPLPTPLYSPNRYTPFPPGSDPFSNSFASANNIPPRALTSSSPSSAAYPRLTAGSPTASALTTIVESSLSEENASEKSASTATVPITDTTSPVTSSAGEGSLSVTSSYACQHGTKPARPALNSVFSGISAGSSSVTSSSADSLLRDNQIASLDLGRSEPSEKPYSGAAAAEAAECNCTTGTTNLPNTEAGPVTTVRRTSSSPTFSSATGMSRASSMSGKRKPPTAYRKEMESVLFAQSAASSSPSSSVSRRSSSNNEGSSSIPTLSSSIFSDATDSIWYTHPNDISAATASAISSRSRSSPNNTASPASSFGSGAPISSIPFLLDAPTLIDTTRSKQCDQDDPLCVSGNNANVVHVNDLSWYLEKVLWKLGLHRKGRKDFMSYWLPRFSNDDYVALRFLTQEAIESLAPIEICVASPTTIDHTGDAENPASSDFSSSDTMAGASSAELLRDSVSSLNSASSVGNEPSGYTSESPLSSRSMSQSTSTTTNASTPASGTESITDKQAETAYSFHRIHVLFQRLKSEDIHLFPYRVKYRSGSSTLGVIDWSEIEGIAPTEESKREDKVRVLHVSATDLGNRGLYFG